MCEWLNQAKGNISVTTHCKIRRERVNLRFLHVTQQQHVNLLFSIQSNVGLNIFLNLSASFSPCSSLSQTLFLLQPACLSANATFYLNLTSVHIHFSFNITTWTTCCLPVWGHENVTLSSLHLDSLCIVYMFIYGASCWNVMLPRLTVLQTAAVFPRQHIEKNNSHRSKNTTTHLVTNSWNWLF